MCVEEIVISLFQEFVWHAYDCISLNSLHILCLLTFKNTNNRGPSWCCDKKVQCVYTSYMYINVYVYIHRDIYSASHKITNLDMDVHADVKI